MTMSSHSLFTQTELRISPGQRPISFWWIWPAAAANAVSKDT